ncbi:TetR/AcrR family transcriptional regulator [Halorientalis pallida]|uniref:TetR/AcrR family transcriptional regulator n=1 Tax=Halorientalis pallida TaxID=2479928 RepID=A0A498KUP3_9EURY|nr:TetR/AcrR family transcriptional regulator [Halorientalis pallida]RXK48682.1 TetR/AcrR family transcriptional regulator [Halorientalis pallida]
MNVEIPFEIESTGTSRLIVESAYKALLEHGYADLTMQQIGAELPRSTSLIYTYYDSKEDLLLDVLRRLLQWLEPEEPIRNQDSHYQLLSRIDYLLNLTSGEAERSGLVAIAVLRANTYQNDRFREEFERADTVHRNHFSTLIEWGIEDNRYCEVDAGPVASYLYSTFLGEVVLSVTVRGSGDLSSVERELKQYVQSRLVKDQNQ